MRKGDPSSDLVDDDTAVVAVIGAVLALGILVLALALLQVHFVPEWNKQVEFDHNQEVQESVEDFRDLAVTTSSKGGTSSVSIKLGPEYPNRVVLFNPSDPPGNVFTTPRRNLSVANASVPGETGDYWNGSEINFSTKSLVYRPQYNEYKSAPVTVYENTVVYNRFGELAGGENVTITNQTVVDGRRIDLVSLTGFVSESKRGTATVGILPASAPTKTVTVSSDGGPITLELPTELPRSKWVELLNDETGSSGHVEDIGYRTGSETNYVVIKLEQGVTYDLNVAKIGANRAEHEGSQYLTDIEGNDTAVSEGGSQKIVVEARDKYNKPLTGATVNFSVSGPGNLTGGVKYVDNVTTDSQGRASVRYFAPDDISGVQKRDVSIDVSINVNSSKATPFDAEAMENVSFHLEVRNSDGSGLGSGGSDNFFAVNWTTPNLEDGVISCDSSGNNTVCIYNSSEDSNDGVLNLTAETKQEVNDTELEFSTNDTSTATVDPKMNTTNSNGVSVTTLDPKKKGAVKVYVSNKVNGDMIEIKILNATNDTYPPKITGFNASNPGGRDIVVEFNSNESLDMITVELTNSSGGFVTNLTESDFTESCNSGTCSYTSSAFTVSKDGNYTATLLEAKDSSGNDGASGQSDTVTVGSNTPPMADFTWTPLNPDKAEQVEFDASASSDPDGTIEYYEWDWDEDGTFEDNTTSPTINHTFGSSGTYNVTLRVTDNESATGTTTKTVSVSGTGPGALVWYNATDWDSIVDEFGVVHESFGDRNSSEVELGYPSSNRWTPSPEAYWPLDENSGSTANDVTGNGYDGTVSGSPGQGIVGILNTTAYSFGTNNYVTAPSTPELSGGPNARITASAWFKSNSITTQDETGIVIKKPSSTNGDWGLVVRPDCPPWGICQGSPPFVGYYSETPSQGDYGVFYGPVSNGAWQHATVTLDQPNGTVRVYYNGQLVAEDTGAPTISDNTSSDIEIGASLYQSTYFDGSIDEVRVYDEVLNASEVNALYEASQAGNFTTDWKTASNLFDVSNLELQSVSAKLNGGSIDVYVESDTDGDGAFDEVSNQISLTGSGPYTVSGLSTDSDTFRLRVEMSTPDVTKSPCFSGAELSAEGGTTGISIGDCDPTKINKPDALVWHNTTDWDSSSENRTVHEGFGDHVSDEAMLGYPSFDRSASNLIGYWHLDEDSGSTANDVANSNDGSVNGAVLGEKGILNTTSFEFAGDDYVNVSDSSSLDSISQKDEFTVSTWVNTSSLGENYLWSRYDGIDYSSGDDFIFAVRDGNVSVFLGDSSILEENISIDTQSEWEDGTFNRTVAQNGELSLAKTGGVRQTSGYFEVPSSTGEIKVNTSFEPDLIEFRVTATNENFDTTTNEGGAEIGIGHGYAYCTASSCREVAQSSGTGSSSPNAHSAASTDSYSVFQIVTDENGDSFEGYIKGTVVNTSSDGFNISFDAVEQQEYVTYTAYDFPAGTDIDVGHFQTPTSAGTDSIDIGFKPNYVQMTTGPAIQGIDYEELNEPTEFGWSMGWAVDANKSVTNITVGEAGRFTPTKETKMIGEAGTFTTSDGDWVTVNFDNTYTNPVIVGTTNTYNGDPGLTFDARNVTSGSAEMRVCETNGTTDGCELHAQETVGYIVVNASMAANTTGIEAGTFDIDQGIDSRRDTIGFGEPMSSSPIVLANVQTANGAQPVETRVTSTSSNNFEAGICHLNSENGCDSSHGTETVGWVAINPGTGVFDQASEAGQTGTVVANSDWESQTFSASFTQTPVVVASTLTENGGQEAQIDEARSVTTSGFEVRYCEIEGDEPDTCDTHIDENVGWLAVEPGNLTVSSVTSEWVTVNFTNTYTNPVVVGTTNTHNGQSALTFDARNVTSSSAEMRVCESEGAAGDGCDTHGPETVGYVVIDAAKVDQVPGLDAGTFKQDSGIDSAGGRTTVNHNVGSSPIVLANVQTTNGAQPVETRVTSTSPNSFEAGICHQDSIDGCDPGHVNETVGWVAISRGSSVFDQPNEAGETGTVVANSAWESETFTETFNQKPVVVVSTLTENGGQELQIDEARSVTTSGVDVRYCEMETGDTCDTHTDENVGWFAAQPGDLTYSTSPVDQQVMSMSAYSQNIDDHVFASSNSEVIHTLWSNKGGIDGRVTAELSSFDSDGFNLDYTRVNPDTNDGNSFLVTYVAIDSPVKPDIGYATTPNSTGTQTVSTDTNLSQVSIVASNTIPGINVEGYSGSNLNSNHLGWMFGAGNASQQESMGYSSHSNSVNAHSSSSSATNAFNLLYTDRNGNVLGKDVAEITGLSSGTLELDWSQITTSSTTNVKYDSVLYFYYGFEYNPPEYVSNGSYVSKLFDAGQKVEWNQTRISEVTPPSTSFDVDYSDGTNWYDNLDDVPKSRYLRYNISLKTTDKNESPSVDKISTSYRTTSAVSSWQTDTESEFSEGSFDDTDTNNDGNLVLSGKSIGEAGKFTTSDGNWVTVNFSNTYTNPVVVGTTNTHNGQSALTFDARNVTSSSAEMRVCESEGAAGDGCDTHGPETVGYVVIDAAKTGSVEGIEAGKFTIGQNFDTITQNVGYTESFGSSPIVLANVQTANGAQPVETRVISTSSTGFEAGICHQDSTDGCDSGHADETVGWVAIEPGNSSIHQINEAGTTGNVVDNSNWESQTFSAAFTETPVVVVSTITEDGPEDVQIDEARSVTTSGVDVRYCETESGDTCDTHTTEDVAWFAVEPGNLTADYSSEGNYTSKLFDAERPVNWTNTTVDANLPSGTDYDINYSDGTKWYDDLSDVPRSRYLRYRITMSTNDTTKTPEIDSVNIRYSANSWYTDINDSSVADGEWHHVAATYNSSALNLYVDGELRESFNISAGIGSSNATRQIGGDTEAGEYTDGRIDEMRLYDRPLTESEISNLYNTSNNATLVTAFKETASPVDPSNLELKNVSATLNGGNITVYVESDTDGDGNVEEVSDAITLDGTGGPYTVTGLSTSSSRYRLRVVFETPVPTESPIISWLELGVQ